MRLVRTVLLVSILVAAYGCSPDSGMTPSSASNGATAGRSVLPNTGGTAGVITPVPTGTGGAGTTGIPPITPTTPTNPSPVTPQAGATPPAPIAGASGMAGLPPAGRGGAAGVPVAGMPPIPTDPNATKPPTDKLPKVSGTCPMLVDGTVTVAGAKVRIWVGSSPGPAYFYFHGTGTVPGEVDQGLPGATSGVRTKGGLVGSWDTSNGKGTNTGTIWYTGDLEGMDQLVACGVEKGIIDTARIHVSGYSAGGLETGAAVFARSNYVASGIVYSGGKPFGAGNLQDPSHVPAIIGAHGAQGQDSLGLDFHDGTIAIEGEIVKLGGFAIDCDDNGDHIGGWFTRAGVGGKALQFLADHPYNTKPSPYVSALPAGFPSFCKIVK